MDFDGILLPVFPNVKLGYCPRKLPLLNLPVVSPDSSLLILTRKRLKSTCDGSEKTVNLGLIALALSDLLICICLLPHGLIRGEY